MQPSLAAAPDTVLEALFASCDYPALFECSHVCTSWRRRTTHSGLWRRVVQQDFTRARNTEYQVVATPVQKRAAVSSSFNTANLFTVEVRMRQRRRGDGDGDGDDDSGAATGFGEGSAGRFGGVPSYAQGLHVYSFGGAFGAPTTSASYYGNSSSRTGRGGTDALQRRSSSSCFSGLGSSAEVREVCVRYIDPLGFTAGHGAMSALRREKARRLATTAASSTDGADTETHHPLPLWEDGSMLRDGVLLCDPHDPGTFCFYAATLQRPWCTVVMDRFFVDDAVLRRLARYRVGGRDGDAAASCCLDLAFRVEALPVVRNDARHPVHTVTPAQPVAIRIGVLERSQLPAYQRGIRHILADMVFYSDAATSATHAGEEAGDRESGDSDAGSAAVDPSAYAWGALDAVPAARGGAARTHGGRQPPPPPEDEIDAEAEVTAWFEASLQAALEAEGSTTAQTQRGAGGATGAAARSSARRSSDGHRATTHAGLPTHAGADGAAFALGDTAASYGYDTEGTYVSEGVAFPLGPPLGKGDVVHLQFWRDEDVIAVARNGERLGTLVADAFSDQQHWCVAVSLQNCGVRFIPPRLS